MVRKFKVRLASVDGGSATRGPTDPCRNVDVHAARPQPNGRAVRWTRGYTGHSGTGASDGWPVTALAVTLPWARPPSLDTPVRRRAGERAPAVEVSAVTVYGRKNIGDHGGGQNNFPPSVLLRETGYAYGIHTRGSPVEDGT
ncbi:hypothetical protein GCM10010360_39040 [Streptomyces nogalater]